MHTNSAALYTGLCFSLIVGHVSSIDLGNFLLHECDWFRLIHCEWSILTKAEREKLLKKIFGEFYQSSCVLRQSRNGCDGPDLGRDWGDPRLNMKGYNLSMQKFSEQAASACTK